MARGFEFGSWMRPGSPKAGFAVVLIASRLP
jgi:hypothetical protein